MTERAVAVVTGAAGGLGLGLASVLVERGFRVVLADIDGEELAVAGAKLQAEGAEVLTVRTDVTKQESVAELAEKTLDHFGRVDVACLNAGVSMRGRAWELSVSDWRWIYDVNVFGVVHGIREFVPELMKADAGRVVITASNSAATTLPSNAPYVSSKHAVLALSETLQHDLLAAGSDLGVSVVLPGAIRSRMADGATRRPDEYGAVSVSEDVREASRSFLERFGEEPVTMARDVLQRALDQGEFCIFTDPTDAEMLSTRVAALREGTLPPIVHFVSKEVQ